MRTTVDFDRDTAKAIDAWRKASGAGLSQAVNDLIRRGLMAPEPERRYEPIPRDLGLTIDVSNIANALDLLEGPDAR